MSSFARGYLSNMSGHGDRDGSRTSPESGQEHKRPIVLPVVILTMLAVLAIFLVIGIVVL